MDDEVVVLTSDEMKKRVAIWKDQVPNKTMMITQRMEGYKRDIYSIIGQGVSEDSTNKTAITDSTGFNVAYVGAEPGNGSTLHTHPEEVEVFIQFSGTWSIFWNEGNERLEAQIGPMDCISVPPKVMRGFRNIGDDYAHLLVMISGAENSTVTRPKNIVKEAATTGLSLDPEGNLIDASG